MNCTQNLQKNAETSNFDDFWAICVRKRIFQEFSKFLLFGPLFPLFSRPVRAQFPLFSRCFPEGFAVKMRKKKKFQKLGPKTTVLKFCPERVKTHQKTYFLRFCAWFSGFAVKTHEKTKIFRNPTQNNGLRSKHAKQTNISE